MGAMYRLKAYFGMVPADELDEYADEPEHYPARRGARERDDRYADRWDDRSAYEPAYAGAYEAEARYDDEWDRRPARTAVADRGERERTPARGLPAIGSGGPAVRGALAIDTDAVREPLRPVPAVAPAPTPVPEQRDRGAAALARIVTLQPSSYKEARTIGEHYRDGQPVIMNLTELDAADAKRLVDFAAGLAFALRGSIDKVTSRVFLLTPADVEVSADDARRLAQRSGVPGTDAERGLFRQD